MKQYASIGVTSWRSNQLDVFVIGRDSALYHKRWNGSAWQPQYPVWEVIGTGFGGTVFDGNASDGPFGTNFFVGAPAVASWAGLIPGLDLGAAYHLDVMAPASGYGSGPYMYYNMFDSGHTDGGATPGWEGFERVGGEVFASPPAMARSGPNRLDAFAVGLEGAMYNAAWFAQAGQLPDWQPFANRLHVWQNLGGHFQATPPAVVSWAENRLDVFGLGADSYLYHKCWDGQQWWPANPDWELLDGGIFASPPAVASWGANRLDIFAVGLEGAIYHKSWDGSAWSPGWGNLGGNFASTPAVVSWAANRLDIFGLGANSYLYHKCWDGQQWWPANPDWELLDGGVFASPPAVASWAANRLDIFAVGLDGAIYHKSWDGSAWEPPTAWTNLGGLIRPFQGPPQQLPLPPPPPPEPYQFCIECADARGITSYTPYTVYAMSQVEAQGKADSEARSMNHGSTICTASEGNCP
jgi:hypothetical protein